ncbi:hypothetical protein LCGC14_0440750 [marine sediment metagenome]|uniref:Uncharacterized protein n=1 Tax=marine sediment metagenome TaxID=412755 RepID=A0A0F9VUM0_9ZZZZ
MNNPAEANMDLYSIDKLMHETRQLAAKYRKATGSTLPVTGEISRFDVAKALNLQLIDDLTLGYDAIGRDVRKDLRILIKGRVIFEDSRSSPRIGQIKSDGRWDRVIMVLFDDDYLPVEMHEASSEDIEAALNTKSESANKKRGAMSVSQFKIIGRLVWSREDGLSPEIWDNHNG